MMFGDTTYESLQAEIMPKLYDFNLNEMGTDYKVPVMFVSGSADWVCPCGMVKEYYDSITAPKKDMYVMEGCGHAPQTQLPEEYANAVKQFLK